ncbi:MAG: ABC transporter substrate-binding protein [Candidatus Hodarchaeales archaeon]
MKRELLGGLVLAIFILFINISTIKVTALIPDDIYIHEEMWGKTNSVDPAVNYDFRGGGVIQQCYETLFCYEGVSTDIIPKLAIDYSVSDDGKTWIFKLRNNVTFHDGTPFNATAMKYSLDRVILMNDDPAWIISKLVLGAPYYAFETNNSLDDAEAWLALNAIEADDINNNLIIHLEEPYTPFLAALTHHVCAAVSPSFIYNHRLEITDYVEPGQTSEYYSEMINMKYWFPRLDYKGSGIVPGIQNKYIDTYTCGTGPYKLTEWKPGELTRMVLERYDNWWKIKVDPLKKPTIKEMYLDVVSKDTDRFFDIIDGECDSTYIPEELMDEIYDLQSEKVLVPGLNVSVYPSFTVTCIGFCLNDTMDYEEDEEMWLEEAATSKYEAARFERYGHLNPDRSKASQDNPLTALKFRKAIAYAFDYEYYLQTGVLGWGERLFGIIPKGMFGHVENLNVIETNAALAKTLFEEVGWRGNIVLAYPFYPGNRFCEIGCLLLESFIENLDVGITIDVKELKQSDYINHINNQHLGIFFINRTADYADPDNYVDPFLDSAGTFARQQVYTNDWISTDIMKGKIEIDPVKRQQLYKKIEEAAIADVVQIYCCQKLSYLVHQENVQGLNGFSINPMQYTNYGYLADIYKEEFATTTNVNFIPGFSIFIILAVMIMKRR